MKSGNWIGLDKNIVKLLPHGRAYTIIEALVSFTIDIDNKRDWTINGYSKQWGWSRNKVRKFTSELGTGSGHLADRKGTGSGHLISLKINNLHEVKDTKRTGKGQEEDRKRYTTINPNPKPNKKPLAGFEDIWKRYPNKDGKKSAEKSFNSTVKTAEDYTSINKALDKYITNLKTETWKKPKNGSTWFNNWQDWIDWEETGTMEPYCTMPGLDGIDIDIFSKEEAEEHKIKLANAANERKGPDGR